MKHHKISLKLLLPFLCPTPPGPSSCSLSLHLPLPCLPCIYPTAAPFPPSPFFPGSLTSLPPLLATALLPTFLHTLTSQTLLLFPTGHSFPGAPTWPHLPFGCMNSGAGQHSHVAPQAPLMSSRAMSNLSCELGTAQCTQDSTRKEGDSGECEILLEETQFLSFKPVSREFQHRGWGMRARLSPSFSFHLSVFFPCLSVSAFLFTSWSLFFYLCAL